MATDSEVVHTERGFDRLVNFTDAVVAIAATLLILPVIENLSDGFSAGDSAVDLLTGSTPREVLAFFAAFWVMTMMWTFHHRAFERLKDYSPGLISLTFLWLISVVFLAFPSGYISYPNSTVWALYFGALALIGLFTFAINSYASKHAELLIDPSEASNRQDYWGLIYPAIWAFGALIAQFPIFANNPDSMYWYFLLPLLVGALVGRKLPPDPRHTKRGLDRIINFSDAVVAIAITLLILPLIDTVTSDKGIGTQLTWSGEIAAKSAAFVIAFLMMSRQWLGNHRTFEKINDYSQPLIRLTFLWLVFMVFLAFPAGLWGIFSESGAANSYLASVTFWATMGLIATLTAVIQLYASRHPALLHDPHSSISAHQSAYLAALYFAMSLVALGLGLLIHDTAAHSVVFMLLAIPVIKRLTEKPESSGHPTRQSP